MRNRYEDVRGSLQVPVTVFEHLRTGLVCDTATEIIRNQTTIQGQRAERSREELLTGFPDGTVIDEADPDTRVIHPGDPFGKVLAWAWDAAQEHAIMMIADLIAQLRHHAPDSEDVDPPIRLDELLEGIRFALPEGFEDHDELIAVARSRVPRYFGPNADPNSP